MAARFPLRHDRQGPGVRERILGAGVEPVQTTPDQFAAFQQADFDKWGRIIKEANIKVDQ